MTHFQITEVDGTIIASDLPPELIKFYNNCAEGKIKQGIYKEERIFFGKKRSHEGIVFLITTDKKHRNVRQFNNLLITHERLIVPAKNTYQTIRKEAEQELDELKHNLVTLNTHNIQDIFLLIPEEELIKREGYEQIKFVEAIVKSKSEEVAKTLLQFSKNNIAIKTEFDVFDKLLTQQSNIQKDSISLRKIVIDIFYIFYQDLYEKNININIFESYQEVVIDEDSARVSFFYLIDNICKYIMPKKNLNIKFENRDGDFCVIFDMISLRIEKDEIDKIFLKGYRGKHVIGSSLPGKGIGMYRVKKALEINNAEIEIQPTNSTKKFPKDGHEYCKNIFIVKFKGQGKYEWGD